VPGPGVWKAVQKDGKALDMFAVLDQLEEAYKTGNLSSRAQGLADVEGIASNVGLAIARTGGAQQRLELSERLAQETTIRAQENLSSIKELDFPSALAQLQKQQLLMEATQSLMGRLSQLSLLDNLR